MPIALGIDFEHIHHTPAFRSLDSSSNVKFDLRKATETILELFDDFDVTATFFVVSDLMGTYSDEIRKIRSEGHEIASHTRHHRALTELSNRELAEEITQSKTALENLLGEPIHGFRAPTCKINAQSYKALVHSGYNYSSSVMPSIPIPGFYPTDPITRTPAKIRIEEGTIQEFPIAVAPGLRLPVSGAWLRLLGRTYTIKALQRQSREGIVCTYSHPWEFQRMQKPLPFRCRFRTGEWLIETYRRVLSLDREFVTYSDLCDRVD